MQLLTRRTSNHAACQPLQNIHSMHKSSPGGVPGFEHRFSEERQSRSARSKTLWIALPNLRLGAGFGGVTLEEAPAEAPADSKKKRGTSGMMPRNPQGALTVLPEILAASMEAWRAKHVAPNLQGQQFSASTKLEGETDHMPNSTCVKLLSRPRIDPYLTND